MSLLWAFQRGHRYGLLRCKSQNMPQQSPLARLAADALQFREHGPNYHESEDLEDPALPLYAQQRDLRRLPVPRLQDTAEKYLASLRTKRTNLNTAPPRMLQSCRERERAVAPWHWLPDEHRETRRSEIKRRK